MNYNYYRLKLTSQDSTQMSNNNTKSTISCSVTNTGSNSASILPDKYKFKGDGSDSHRWREVKDQVLNKSMSQHEFKISFLEEKQKLDEALYKMSKGEMQEDFWSICCSYVVL